MIFYQLYYSTMKYIKTIFLERDNAWKYVNKSSTCDVMWDVIVSVFRRLNHFSAAVIWKSGVHPFIRIQNTPSLENKSCCFWTLGVTRHSNLSQLFYVYTSLETRILWIGTIRHCCHTAWRQTAFAGTCTYNFGACPMVILYCAPPIPISHRFHCKILIVRQ